MKRSQGNCINWGQMFNLRLFHDRGVSQLVDERKQEVSWSLVVITTTCYVSQATEMPTAVAGWIRRMISSFPGIRFESCEYFSAGRI